MDVEVEAPADIGGVQSEDRGGSEQQDKRALRWKERERQDNAAIVETNLLGASTTPPFAPGGMFGDVTGTQTAVVNPTSTTGDTTENIAHARKVGDSVSVCDCLYCL